ncbi:MAG: hypothetical protein FK730_05680 [Asgard group archaeon]|nr:hypothetical protein [Asgard group archaeon]
MSDSEKKRKEMIAQKILKNKFIEGEGVSDIDEKRQKAEEKRKIKISLDSHEEESIAKQISEGFAKSIVIKDVLIYIFAQFLPLIILGSAMFIPSIYYLNLVSLNIRGILIILLIFGNLVYLYAIFRTIGAFSYKIEITNEKLKWRNIFWWNTIENINLLDAKPIGSYYFYFIRIGGILRFGIEGIFVKSDNKEYWIRTYPFYKKKADELAKIIHYWINISQLKDVNKDNS